MNKKYEYEFAGDYMGSDEYDGREWDRAIKQAQIDVSKYIGNEVDINALGCELGVYFRRFREGVRRNHLLAFIDGYESGLDCVDSDP